MYWCLHNNEVIFSFLGHSDLITDITMNPVNDLFLTTSRDKTSRLWDLSQRICTCIFQDSNHACFDNSGKVIASVTSETEKSSEKIINYVNLYSAEDVLKGPFKVFKITEGSEIKQLKFSVDGSYIVCATIDNLVLVLDAYEGDLKNKLTGEINESDLCFKIDISDDSRYVVSGTESGNVLIWNLENGAIVANLECHPTSSNCVKFSHKQAMLATGCTNLAVWHPSLDISEINK